MSSFLFRYLKAFSEVFLILCAVALLIISVLHPSLLGILIIMALVAYVIMEKEEQV